MSSSIWTSVIIMATVLALAVRALAGQRVERSRLLVMAAIWAAIIAALAVLLRGFAP